MAVAVCLVTWGTSEHFLDEFGIEQLEDLPGIDELKAAGLLDSRPGIMSLGQLSDGDMSEASSNKDDNFIDDNTLLEDAQDELNANPQDKPPSEAVEETKPPA